MVDKVYLEVGNKCFCKCITCNVHHHRAMALPVARRAVDKLHDYGVKQIRLCGNDPLTYRYFNSLVKYIKSKGMEVSVTTTLLAKNIASKKLHLVDNLAVSLSAVGKHYNKFFIGGDWKLFKHNLSTVEQHIRINYTIYSNNISVKEIIKFILFCNGKDVDVVIYPMIDYDGYKWGKMIHVKFKVLLMLLARFKYKYIPEYTKTRRTSCNVENNECYVKYNGDIYPCCMAGGEIGQQLYKELCLGNVFTDDLDEVFSKKLMNLDNPTCSNCTQKYKGGE